MDFLRKGYSPLASICGQPVASIMGRTKLIKGVNDLAAVNPTLAAQWHPTKNETLTPDMVTPSSHKRVWWICSKDHEWQAAICDRTIGRGCPVCNSPSMRRVIVGKTDLASVNPDLAKEWHPTKNATLTPEMVTSGSNKKVWWVCSKGHEWQAAIYDRTAGRGCPVCNGPSKRRVIVGKTDLASVNPELAKEWHPTKNGDLTPKDVTAKSNQKIWWQCKEGHEWQTQVFQRQNGNGCPICSRIKQNARTFIPLSSFPELAKEWHPTKNGDLTPADICASSVKKVWWICEKGHEWQATVNSRKSAGAGCARCVRRRVTPGENDLLTLNPDLAKEWHPTKNGDLTPSDVSCNSGVKVWWQCAEGHEWQAVVAARNRGSSCLRCLMAKRHKELYSNAVLSPELSSQWHPTKNGTLQPDQFVPSSHKRVWWQCENGHEWKAPIVFRAKKGEGCPICTKTSVQQSLADADPSLAAEWHPTRNGTLQPSDVTLLSDIIVWWQCENGHEWQASVINRRQGVGCPFCRYQTASSDTNTLASKNLPLAVQWHPTKNGDLTPDEVTPNSSKKAWWLCNKGHEWEAVIASRNRGARCPFCTNKKILAGYNDLATIDPELAREWHPTKNGDLTPRDVFTTVKQKVWWQCENGHEWEALIVNRRMGAACPVCANKKERSETE